MVPKDISIQISAPTVAWYGAIVATVSLVVGLYKVWVDHARVGLRVQPEMVVGGEKSDEKYFFISVVNKGRRPVTITHIGLKLFNGKSVVKGASVRDVELTEGRDTEVLFSYDPERDLVPGKVKNAFAVTSTGRTYRKYLSKFPTFKGILFKLGVI